MSADGLDADNRAADNQALDYLARLGAQPAVAFHENGVATAVRSALTGIGVSWRTDAFGNIIARIPGTGSDAGAASVPPIAFMAHMDHPGFEVIGRDGDYLIGRASGGIPPGAFEPGVPLRIVLPAGRQLPAETAGKHGPECNREMLIHLIDDAGAGDAGNVPTPAPAVFDLPDFSIEDDYLVMRAADDLAGCGCILTALAQLNDAPPPGDVYGVFTRAEEVGLVGARLLAEARTLPADTLVVSLESSRTLPGAEIGSGPVIRTGDAGSTFNHDAEAALIRAREVLTAGDATFRCQRQLMSGGVCEASAFLAYGYRATGVAFPLGNYHNGAPDGTVQAEYIHRSDYLNGAALITEAARQVGMRWDTAFSRRIRQVPDAMRSRLGG